MKSTSVDADFRATDNTLEGLYNSIVLAIIAKAPGGIASYIRGITGAVHPPTGEVLSPSTAKQRGESQRWGVDRS